MLHKVSLTSEIKKQQTNQFVVKNLLIMTLVFITKNWTHTHDLKTLANLVSESGGKELQSHLLTPPEKKKLYVTRLFTKVYSNHG